MRHALTWPIRLSCHMNACFVLQSTRSYLYVEDVAEAFEVILRKGLIGETYNIGTQKERTVMDVAHCIAERFNLPMDNIVHVRDRAFNDQRWEIIIFGWSSAEKY